MSMEYVRNTYKVPAKRGGKVRYAGFEVPKVGKIVSSKGGYIRVAFPGESRNVLLHPTWNVEYL